MEKPPSHTSLSNHRCVQRVKQLIQEIEIFDQKAKIIPEKIKSNKYLIDIHFSKIEFERFNLLHLKKLYMHYLVYSYLKSCIVGSDSKEQTSSMRKTPAVAMTKQFFTNFLKNPNKSNESSPSDSQENTRANNVKSAMAELKITEILTTLGPSIKYNEKYQEKLLQFRQDNPLNQILYQDLGQFILQFLEDHYELFESSEEHIHIYLDKVNSFDEIKDAVSRVFMSKDTSTKSRSLERKANQNNDLTTRNYSSMKQSDPLTYLSNQLKLSGIDLKRDQSHLYDYRDYQGFAVQRATRLNLLIFKIIERYEKYLNRILNHESKISKAGIEPEKFCNSFHKHVKNLKTVAEILKKRTQYMNDFTNETVVIEPFDQYSSKLRDMSKLNSFSKIKDDLSVDIEVCLREPKKRMKRRNAKIDADLFSYFESLEHLNSELPKSLSQEENEVLADDWSMCSLPESEDETFIKA